MGSQVKVDGVLHRSHMAHFSEERDKEIMHRLHDKIKRRITTKKFGNILGDIYKQSSPPKIKKSL